MWKPFSYDDVAGRPEPHPPLPALVRGGGDPLVIIHGFGLGPRTYGRTVDLLADKATVFIPRWLETERPWTYERALSGIEALLDHHRIEGARIVGHSFGGALALGYVARFPERVRQAVFVNSDALWGHWDLAREALPGLLRLYRLASAPAALDFLRNSAARPSDLGRAAWWGFNCDLGEEMRAVRQAGLPAHVLWAERDTLVSKSSGLRFARAIGADFSVVADPGGRGPVDHDWVFRHPRLFAGYLSELGLIGHLDDPPVEAAG